MPSRHSSSSHSSHSSSHHSSSHHSSHSSSHHSHSSHSSSYSHSGSSYHSAPVYKTRTNQPTGYRGKNPRIYRCKHHDYVHFDIPWTDEATGREYRAGYYDEDGNFYEDIVFSKHGKILDNTTAVCRCDYCRMEDSRAWADREKPCTHCGGTMTVISQMDDLEDEGGVWNPSKNKVETSESRRLKKILLIALIVILSPCILTAFLEGLTEKLYPEDESSYESSEYYDSGVTYNIPDLGDTMYLVGEEGTYSLTDQSDYQENNDAGGYKKLVLDSDGNYYDKSTEGYVWLNEYIDPPQFQYWFEGISSEYGDFGWMEYDVDESRWYIEVEEEKWEPLDDAVYEKNMNRLWHIEYDFTD